MPQRNTKNKSIRADACPCGSGSNYTQCCGRLHNGEPASSAEALMRSRYAAFALNLPEYIARSWHSSTRPLLDQLRASGSDASHWIGLKIKRHTIIDADHAQVEFTARYKIASRAYVLQETSNFVRENDHWFYVDGRIES